MKPTIATYFEPLTPKFSKENHEDLRALWSEIWRGLGFDVAILGVGYAWEHPLYQNLLEKVSAFPSLNDASYERHCFLRWAALGAWSLQNPGPVLFMDYDVFPTASFDRFPQGGFAPASMTIGDIPSCIFLNGSAAVSTIENILAAFMAFRPVKHCGHVSDQTILSNSRPIFDAHSDKAMRCYGVPGWEDSDLVHFANWTLCGVPSRAEFVRSLLRDGKIEPSLAYA
jgi:hypothetical protein